MALEGYVDIRVHLTTWKTQDGNGELSIVGNIERRAADCSRSN